MGSRTHKSKTLAGNTRDGLFAAEIGDVDKGIVERGVYVGDTKDILALGNLGTKLDGSLFPGGLCFLRRLFMSSSRSPKVNPSMSEASFRL